MTVRTLNKSASTAFIAAMLFAGAKVAQNQIETIRPAAQTQDASSLVKATDEENKVFGSLFSSLS